MYSKSHGDKHRCFPYLSNYIVIMTKSYTFSITGCDWVKEGR